MGIQGNEEGMMKAKLAISEFNLEIIKFIPSLLPLLLATDPKKVQGDINTANDSMSVRRSPKSLRKV
jgi:hypothetical protein